MDKSQALELMRQTAAQLADGEPRPIFFSSEKLIKNYLPKKFYGEDDADR